MESTGTAAPSIADAAATTHVCTCTTPAVISVSEAAALLGRSLEYLYAGIREHRFPVIRFGRGVALPRAFIENFIANAMIGRAQVSFEDYAADWMAGKTVASKEVA